jgi:DNA repair protein RadC
MNKKHQTITDWSMDDRPREKLIKKGVKALSNSELLAILFRSGTKEKNAVDLAREVLDNCGNDLNKLSKLNYFDLKEIDGIGDAKAISIIAAFELGRRRPEINPNQQITTSNSAFNIIHPYFKDQEQEEVYIIYLSHKLAVIEIFHVSKGSISASIVDIRIILKRALQNLASSIIIAHNHPSGSLEPSKNDIDITNSLKQACDLLTIKLMDHLIIGNDNYYSFADENKL